MDDRRIASFISMVICFILAIFSGCLAYYVGLDVATTNGAEALVLVVQIPLTIFLYSIALAFIIATFVTSIRAIGSSVTALRVISIVILALTGMAFVLLIIAFLGAIKII